MGDWSGHKLELRINGIPGMLVLATIPGLGVQDWKN